MKYRVMLKLIDFFFYFLLDFFILKNDFLCFVVMFFEKVN